MTAPAQLQANRLGTGILAALKAPFVPFQGHRQLGLHLTRQRLILRYRESLLGALWMVLSPALLLGIYTLVFAVIFAPRWVPDSDEPTEYAFLLYLALCAFWLVSEVLSEAPGLIHRHASYVKKVAFPLELLSWVSLVTAVFHLALRLAVFVTALALVNGSVPVTLVALPLALLPLLLLALGLSWALAAVGVFLRDLEEGLGFVLTALLFLSPVFYPIHAVPETFRGWLTANPLTAPIGFLRDVAYFGRWPDPTALLAAIALGYLVAVFGYALFQRSRKAFADVL